MPVKSLNSSVLKWPKRGSIHRAVRAWAAQQIQSHPEILRVGYFGSYARGDWGVGSDLDILVVIENSSQPFWQRSLGWDTSSIPVPVEILIYTLQEWQGLAAQQERFYQTIQGEAVWVFEHESDR